MILPMLQEFNRNVCAVKRRNMRSANFPSLMWGESIIVDQASKLSAKIIIVVTNSLIPNKVALILFGNKVKTKQAHQVLRKQEFSNFLGFTSFDSANNFFSKNAKIAPL